MEPKEMLGYLFSAFLGYLIVREIYNIVFFFSMTVLISSLGQAIYGIPPQVLDISMIFVVLLGIYSGVKSFRDKNIFYEIFRPEKNKLILNLAVSLVFVSFIISYIFLNIIDPYAGVAFVIPDAQLASPLGYGLIFALLIIAYYVLFYPFSCLLYHLYSKRRDKKLKAGKKAFCLMILLNPLFVFVFAASYPLLGGILMTEPCGVTYHEFLPDSAARDAGMEIGDVIVRIDNTDIKSAEDLRDYLDSVSYDKPILIQTSEGKEYLVTPRFDESENRYMIGIRGTATKICSKEQ